MRIRIGLALAAAALLVGGLIYVASTGADGRTARRTSAAGTGDAEPAGGGGPGRGDVTPGAGGPADGAAEGDARAPAGPGVLAGVVRDGNGPVPGALVYLIPKGTRGTDDANALQVARADPEGRFAVRNARPARCWLGVVAERHRPRFLDADALPPDPLEIALEAGYDLEVAFGADENIATRKVLLRVATAEGVAAFRFPGPDAQARVNLGAAIEVDPPTALVLEGPGPYHVEIEGDRLYWEPPAQKVELPGRAFFQLLPSATIVVELKDAETGDPFRDEGVLSAARGSGTVAVSATRGEVRVLQRQILPGTYDLEFRTPGYRTWEARGVRVEDAGAQLSLEAPLVRDPALGELRVRGITAAGGAVRRSGDTAWMQPTLERRGEGLTRLRGIEAGTVDVLLWSAAGDEVAVLAEASVPGGGVVEAKATPVDGVFCEPPALGVQAGSDLRVEADALGVLPFLVPGAALPAAGAPWPLAGGPTGRLGPFPRAPGLCLVETRAGRRIVHTLAGEPAGR